jgi:hypothetical protein
LAVGGLAFFGGMASDESESDEDEEPRVLIGEMRKIARRDGEHASEHSAKIEK